MDRRTYLGLASTAVGTTGIGAVSRFGLTSTNRPWSGALCVIDDFSDGVPAEYDLIETPNAVEESGGTLRLTATTDVISHRPDVELPRYAVPGSTFSCWTYAGGEADDLELTYGVQDEGNRYSALVHVEDSEIELRRRAVGRFGTARRASTNEPLSRDSWYRLQVEWTRQGPHVVRLYDSEKTRIARLESDPDRFYGQLGPGGFGYGASVPTGDARFENATIDGYDGESVNTIEDFDEFRPFGNLSDYRGRHKGLAGIVSTPAYNGESALELGGPSLPVTDGLVLRLNGERGVSTSGDNVTGWADQSGRGNDLSARGDPVTTETPSGRRAISFGGDRDRLERVGDLRGLPGGDDSRTAVSIVRYDTAIGRGIGGITYGSPRCGRAFGIGIDPDGNLALQGWCARRDYPTSTPAVGRGWMVQSAVLDADSFGLYKDGARIGSGPNTFDTRPSRLVIGAEMMPPPFIEMDVAAVLVYDRALTESERRQVEGYLRESYLGTTPPTPNLVRSGGRPIEPSAGDTFSARIRSGDADWIEFSYGVQSPDERYAARVDFDVGALELRRYGSGSANGGTATAVPGATGTPEETASAGPTTAIGTSNGATPTDTASRPSTPNETATATPTGTTTTPTATPNDSEQPSEASELAVTGVAEPLEDDRWYEVRIDWRLDGEHVVSLRPEGGTPTEVTATDSTWSEGGTGYDASTPGDGTAYVDYVVRYREGC